MKTGILITVLLVVAAFIWAIKSGASAKNAPAIVAASAVIAAAIFSALITQQQIREREISESHRLQKIEVYGVFSDLYLATLKTAKVAGDKKKLAAAQDDIVEQMFQYSKRAMLWASPEVLLAYSSYREYGQNKGSGAELLLRVDDVLQAMRKDLGLSNSGLERGALVKMYLTDPESLNAE